jgi:hypothetical protein
MALRYNKLIQVMDLGSYRIKYGVFKISKDTEEVEALSREIYKIPNPYSGVALYLENFGQYLKEIHEKLDKKLPIRFSASSLFAPTNLAYLTRIEQDSIDSRLREELEKFAGQEKIAADNEHNQVHSLFTKEIEAKSQVVAATIVLNPKYVGMLKNHLYAHNLKFGGIYPLMQSSLELYRKVISLQEDLLDKPLVFVDVGQMTTKVNLFFDGQLLFNKVLHYGARSFCDELFEFASKSGDAALSPAEVEDVLQKVGFSGNSILVNQMGLDINDPGPYLQQMDSTLKSIFTKINSSVNYFTSALARNFSKDNAAFMTIRKGASHVFFSGGITNAPSFYDKAGQNFNCSVHLLQPLAIKSTLGQTSVMFQQDDFRMDMRQNSPFADCAAACFLGLDSAKANLNLVSKIDSENENIIQILRKLPLVKYRTALIAILVITLLKTGWKWFQVTSEFNQLATQVATLKKKTKGSNQLRQEMLTLKQEKILNDAKIGYVRSVIRQYVYWPRILQLLMSKISADIKLTTLSFKVKSPEWDKSKAKKYANSQKEADFPWKPMAIEWKMRGDALTRTTVPKLIQTLKNTGIFQIPKPPSSKFVKEQEKKKKGTKPGEEEYEIISEHYEFDMTGFIQQDNTI